MSIDLYELKYKDFKCSKKYTTNTDLTIPKNATRSIINILKDFQYVKSADIEEVRFSDVICNIIPLFEENNSFTYKYEYIINNKKIKINPNDLVERFKKFDVNTLPLIKVAKYLNIKIEKSNILKPYGRFIPSENKIILCSDYVPTFLHELAHAIDYYLENSCEDHFLDNSLNFDELVAELSAVILCKKYNIPINESYSKFYLDCYTKSDIDLYKVINRVSLICDFVKSVLS